MAVEPATIVAATAAAATQPTFIDILDKVLSLGIAGLVIVLWYFGTREKDEVLRRSDEKINTALERADVKTDKVLNQYAEHMKEMREMYVTNAALVKRYADLAGDLKEVITLNTQVNTQLVDRIEREVCK